MKYLAVFVAVLGYAAAQKFTAARAGDEIVITRSESENNGDGTFKWVSELSDGTKLSQNGYIKPGPDPENPIQVIQGSFSYTAPDGQPISLTYTADENGFVPVADHLPTPPPIPAEIQKALDIIYSNVDKAAASSQVNQQYRPAPPQAPLSRGLQQPRRF